MVLQRPKECTVFTIEIWDEVCDGMVHVIFESL